jgi:HEAT repeat protein
MFSHTVEFFRFVNIFLITGILFLYCGIFAYVFLKEHSESRYQRRMEQLKNRLWDLFLQSPDGVRKACPVIVRAFDLRQIFDIARYEGYGYSREFGHQIRECLLSSVDMNRMERLAGSSRNKWHRIEAIIILGYVDTPQAVKILTANLTHKDEDVVYFSILALSQRKTSEIAGLLLKSISKGIVSGQKIVSLLENFPLSVADSVCAELKDPDLSVRYWALKLLARLKFVEAVPLVAGLTRDRSADVRAAACECLGVLAKREAREVLMGCLKDEAWFVRMFAVRALGVIFGSESLELVAGLIDDASWPVKESVEKILARHIEKALPYLERCLVSPDGLTRASCVSAFVDAVYIPKILEDILDGSLQARELAQRLLEELIRSNFYFGLKKAVDGLQAHHREKILQVVSGIDGELARKLQSEDKNKTA